MSFVVAGVSVSGLGCVLDGANCVTSANYPSHYDNDQACTVAISPATAVDVVAFETESGYDIITVNGVDYDDFSISGDGSGLDGKVTTGLDWVSDGSATRSGWKICFDGILTVATGVNPDTTSVNPAWEELYSESKTITFFLNLECAESSMEEIGLAVMFTFVEFGIAEDVIVGIDVACGSVVVTAVFTSDGVVDTVTAAVLADEIVVEVNGIFAVAVLVPLCR
jgi:hypothetical protein